MNWKSLDSRQRIIASLGGQIQRRVFIYNTTSIILVSKYMRDECLDIAAVRYDR